MAASWPAPKPLSMLTTATPDVQAFSIASSAASPWNEAPYPMLVGTAMTGASTRPPTTEGSLVQQTVDARHAHVVDALHPSAEELKRHGGLLGDGHVGGAGADDGDTAWEAGGRGHGHRDAVGHLVEAGFGLDGRQLPVHVECRAGHEGVLSAGGDPLHDGDDLLGGLAGPEDGLGIAAAQGAMQIHLRKAQVLVGQRLQSLRRLAGGHPSVPDSRQEILEVLGVHAVSPDIRPLRGGASCRLFDLLNSPLRAFSIG